MSAYGKTREEAETRINSYKNPDPRCTYPFTCDPLGYCFSYAHHIDGTKGFEDMQKRCTNCECWKPIRDKTLYELLEEEV